MALKHGKALPEEVAYIALLDRMRCNYWELQGMPMQVIEDYIIMMQAEAMVEKANG